MSDRFRAVPRKCNPEEQSRSGDVVTAAVDRVATFLMQIFGVWCQCHGHHTPNICIRKVATRSTAAVTTSPLRDCSSGLHFRGTALKRSDISSGCGQTNAYEIFGRQFVARSSLVMQSIPNIRKEF